MRIIPASIGRAAAVAVAGAVLAGCTTTTGGGGHGSASASPGFPSSSSAAGSSPAPGGSASVSVPGSAAPGSVSAPPSLPSASIGSGGLSAEKARAALLVTADVGAGFAAGTGVDNNNPAVCTPNDPPLNVQVPSQRVQAAFQQSSGQAALTEQIAVYADAAAAEKALAVVEHGLACGTATVDTGATKTTLKITGPMSLTADLHVRVDKCEGWTVETSTADTGLVTARIGQQLVSLTFSKLVSADDNALPDSQAITERALAKVKAAL